MSTTYGVAGFGQTAALTRRVSSLFWRYWGAFQERRERERLRAALYDLTDRELKDIGIGRGEAVGRDLSGPAARHALYVLYP